MRHVLLLFESCLSFLFLSLFLFYCTCLMAILLDFMLSIKIPYLISLLTIYTVFCFIMYFSCQLVELDKNSEVHC